jgi:hypothetical protein
MMLEGVTITGVTLTDEAAHRIFETAIDAGHTYGFGYWAETEDMESRRAGFGEMIIVRLRLRERLDDGEPGKGMWIEKADLERGVRLMLGDEALDEDRFDGPQAERILQYAMFGEVKYG